MADSTTSKPAAEKAKHAGGRPLKFETAAALQAAVDAYFNDCDPHQTKVSVVMQKADGTPYVSLQDGISEQKPYVVAGLAYALGVDRRTLINYKSRDEFFPTIDSAMRKIEAFAETMLYSRYQQGARFNLTNNYDDWKDQSHIDATTNGKELPAPILGGVSVQKDDDAVD